MLSSLFIFGRLVRNSSSMAINSSLASNLAIFRGNKLSNFRITKSKEWKNTYSGVFLDMSEVLIPLDFIQEQGRMPLNRGPKALQEKGVPYYGLTRKGFIVAMALSKTVNVRAVLGACFIGMTEEEKEIKNIMIVLYKTSPKLVRHLFEKYVRAYCEGKFDSLLPLNIAKFEC